jgi:hypothetical protein
MGRFDALTELDENNVSAQQPGAQPLEAASPASETPQPQPVTKQKGNDKKQVTRQPGTSINAVQPKQDKFDKYSTYLRPGYKKLLRSISNDRECKDYEVLDEALTLFFDTLKK